MAASAKDILISELKDANADLRAMNRTLHKSLESSTGQIKQLMAQVASLTEKVEYLTRKLFGTSREKTQMDGQLGIFDGDGTDTADGTGIDFLPPIEIKPHSRKPKTKLDEKIRGLPVERIEFTLDGADADCPYCVTPMEVMGRKVVRREVELIPAKVKVLEYVSLHYGCPVCKDAGQPCIVHAPVPDALMKHSAASPSTVAWVMYQKYHNGMPLYRQQNDWKHTGFELSRATMANWVIFCSEHYLKPIYEYARRLLVLREFAMADETRVQVLKEPGRKAETDSFMWAFRSGEDGLPPIIIFKYSETRAGDNARDVLNGFRGYLMTDAFSGYNKVKDVKHCVCYAHLRRHFFDAVPKGMKDDFSHPAVQGVGYIDRLFHYERVFKEQGHSAEQVRKKRLEKEKPIIDAFNVWVDKQRPVPGSKLDKAVTYAINRRGTMETYLEDGRCSLSNALTELLMKAFATGRKGWLFSDSVDGVKASAITYSIALMAKENGLNVYEYMKHLLVCRPHVGMADAEMERLLPWHPNIVAKCGL